ncbi:MAG: M42 family metallopeptidase [Flavobacteriales bacterium]|nr:M42 family metallopeptidase [Flavobacteriales bacterium]MCW8911705.1 M42 family metallopeptidase [Flavobacteriales bacterium]MCW8936964.1 M42 family metallopeptidase [Flavobacteriales bacterium]MCW8941207.1 M42 family metallopeptidase [Flavobacteriales bacterium]MCW8968750.1 M42 family metallopeptidase [Flavobacteriales bacterium]
MNNYKTLQELIAIDSPSGYTDNASKYIYDLLKSYGYQPEFTNKGAVRCALGNNPTLALAAHVDTLGAIVSGVKPNGTLAFSLLGGLSLTGAEGEYVKIITHEGKIYTGTILLNNPSVHANKEKEKTERSTKSMHIRIDEEVYTKEDVEKLGIEVGDIICVDVKYQELKNGFIKSRFLDNKAGCFVLFEIARRLKQQNKEVPVELFFSNYEEVGHGGTVGYSQNIKELLVLDMGVLGDDCQGNEVSCSICAKDSSGPYDYTFRKKLVDLAKKNNIPYKIDVYPHYGSDGSAALRAGNDFRVGLIGMGVAASHGTERTHKKGIEATIDLCLAYINQYN